MAEVVVGGGAEEFETERGADAVQADVNESMWASADQKRGLAAFGATGPGSAVFRGD